MPLGRCGLERFPDGELDVQLHENVRGAEVFIVQSLHAPVGEHLLELALMSDACQRLGATSVTAVGGSVTARGGGSEKRSSWNPM